jgi:hypothetical protein
MNEVTIESLKKIHGDKAAAVFSEIAELGGFGAVSTFNYGIDPACALDVKGCLDPENKAVSAENKAKIKALLTKEVAKNDNGTAK